MTPTLIADCETDGFLDAMTRLWTLQIGDASTDEVTVYADQPGFPTISEGLARLQAADFYVFHHGLGFDLPAINKIYPGTLTQDKMIDTLVLARMAEPEQRSHQLKAWGERLGIAKGEYKGDFSKFDDELVVYSRQDIVVGRALFHAVKHVLGWGTSYRLEHDTARALILQEINGFGFDVPAAIKLDGILRAELGETEAALQVAFPPLQRTTTLIPKRNNGPRGLTAGVPHHTYHMEPFNPGSRLQVAERLKLLGWVPSSFTPSGDPQVDEKTLAAMAYPQAVPMRRYFELAKALGQLSDGKTGWLRCVKPDGRIHGRVNHVGAKTHRMSHSGPNVAQVSKDSRMRALWIPRPGWLLVGCDGASIQLRCLAHYLAPLDGGKLAERIVSGTKEARTDPHSANLKALVAAGVFPRSMWDDACRDAAKTMVYALLFGSTDNGLGRTAVQAIRDAGLKPPRLPLRELGRLANLALANSMTGLDVLQASIGAKIEARKELKGLDGRRLHVDQRRLGLVALCQSAEAIIMKTALVAFLSAASERGWEHGRDYGLCASVHDEQQLEARPEIARDIGALFAGCISGTTVQLGFRCPLEGDFNVGNNWSETH